MPLKAVGCQVIGEAALPRRQRSRSAVSLPESGAERRAPGEEEEEEETQL